MRGCDFCGWRPATESTEELPDCVSQDYYRVCPECWSRMKAEARVLGYVIR